MRWIKEAEAKERFAELLEEVEQGETVAIVREGRKIAQIVPGGEREDSDEERQRRKEAVDKFLEWRSKQPPTGITLEEILEWRHGDPFSQSQ